MANHTQFLTKNSTQFQAYISAILAGSEAMPTLAEAKAVVGTVSSKDLDKKQAMLYLTASYICHHTHGWSAIKEATQPEGDLTEETLDKWSKGVIKCLNAIRTLSMLTELEDGETARSVFINPLLANSKES